MNVSDGVGQTEAVVPVSYVVARKISSLPTGLEDTSRPRALCWGPAQAMWTDEAANTLTVTDTGIGMTREEMTSNLGTIARSGSKSFMKKMQRKRDMDDPGDVAPFGQRGSSGSLGWDGNEGGEEEWESTGSGKYSISSLLSGVRQDHSTSVVLHLKLDLEQFVDEKTIEGILKKYSNFGGFPIYLNGNQVNTVDAVLLHDPKEVTEETHSSLYKHAHDEPLSAIYFRVDAPLDIKALFYIPSFDQEKHGLGRMDPGVSLYSHKVLIESKSPDILREWCRFVKGVVDSEDLPLSISRKKPQDTALMHKMHKALTRKVIEHLAKMMKKDPTKYKEEFYGEYAFFLKEGVCQDFDSQEPLSKLLMFVYSAINESVMTNLKAFEGRNLVSVDWNEIDLPKKDADKKKDDKDEVEGDKDKATPSGTSLSKSEAVDFCAWFQSVLGTKVSTCWTTDRLTSSPAVVTNASVRPGEEEEGGSDGAKAAGNRRRTSRMWWSNPKLSNRMPSKPILSKPRL
ncbi:hypothetical protein ACHAWF_018889 [Thalassiosira exigua]